MAIELNQMGIPSPSGKHWTEVTVNRTVTSEVHLGRVVYGKTSGDYHKKKQGKNPLHKNDRTDWIVAEGTHEPLKTLEEHARILEAMERRKIIPKKARASVYALSGVVRCGSCGYGHGFYTKENGKLMLKPCVHRDPLGNKCKNKGIDASVLYQAVASAVEEQIEQIMAARPGQGDQPNLHPMIEAKRQELAALEAGTERIQDMYVMGIIDKAQLADRMAAHNEKIRAKRNEVSALEETAGLGKLQDDERLERLQELKKVWSDSAVADSEKNRVAKQIVEKIVYTRPTVQDVSVEVVLL